MTRKEFIEYLEALMAESRNKMDKAMTPDKAMTATEWDSVNYQMGKITLCQIAIRKLKEKKESEVGE
jgi:hypothetical protein